jgi:peptidyl-prolyl cis-trans isomerase A (cyclophilin A)
LVLAVGFATAAGAQEAAADPVAPAASPAAEAPPAPPPPPAIPPVNVMMHTALGDIRVALDKQHAPVTVANFLRYVDSKRFDGITFYRAVKIGPYGNYGMLQGGLRGNPKKVYPPIAHESPRTTGLSHLDGALSMARAAPGSAKADFFFVIGDLVSLDGQPTGDDVGYAVFGRVTEGMDVVRKILDEPIALEAGEGVMKGQMLFDPVKILTVRRVD